MSLKLNAEVRDHTEEPSTGYDVEHVLPIPAERELMERVGWFIKLRWCAGLLVVIGTFFAGYVLGLNLPVARLSTIGLAILLYNLFFFRYFRRLGGHPERGLLAFRRFANLQVDVDWVVLVLIMYHSGGLQSPALFYFVFHIIIASILLPRRDCYLQATFATALVALGALLEYYNIILPVKLQFMSDLDSLSLISRLFFFVSTMYTSVFLATSLQEALKSKERTLMSQQTELESTYHALAHDLRRPITAVQTMLNMILAGHGGAISDEARGWIERSEHRLRFDLHRRVDDVLNWAARRVKLIESVVTHVRLLDVVTKAALGEREIAEEKGVKIETNILDESLAVRGDRDDLEQVLAELVHNAVKYTPPEGVVTLSAQAVDGKARIEITDTGIGIPKEELSSVFREFYRADNAQQSDKYGTGLGLSIVKQIVDAHEGNVSVYSELGKGTRVIIVLPRAEYEKEAGDATGSLLSTVESLSGQKLRNCYQCQKCSAGCPVAREADYTVNQMVRLVQMNQASKALQSSMIWLCTACETCGARCPNDINMAPVMDVLKQLALQEEGMEIKEEHISAFHSVFLKNVKSHGRLHELGMMGFLRLRTGGLFSDLGIAFDLTKKGKLKMLPDRIKGRRGIKRTLKSVV